MAMSRWLALLLASALLACVAAETHRVDEKGFRNLLKTIFQKYSYRPKALLVDKKKELADMTINLQDKLGHGILVINLQDSPTMQQIMLKDLPIKELPACFVMYNPNVTEDAFHLDASKRRAENFDTIQYQGKDFSEPVLERWLRQFVPRPNFEDDLDLPLKRRETKDEKSVRKLCINRGVKVLKDEKLGATCFFFINQRKEKEQRRKNIYMMQELMAFETIWAPFYYSWSQGQALKNVIAKQGTASNWPTEYPQLLAFIPALETMVMYPPGNKMTTDAVRDWMVDFDAPLHKLEERHGTKTKASEPVPDELEDDGADTEADDEL